MNKLRQKLFYVESIYNKGLGLSVNAIKVTNGKKTIEDFNIYRDEFLGLIYKCLLNKKDLNKLRLIKEARNE